MSEETSTTSCSKCYVVLIGKCRRMCSVCHKKEVEKVHSKDTPDTPDFKDVVRYVPPDNRILRGKVQRVIKKGSPFS